MGYSEQNTTKSSRTTGLSITAICIRETNRVLASNWIEKLAAKYPYEPAYLPVARLEDGTLLELVRSKLMKSILIEKPNQLAIIEREIPTRQRVKFE